MKDAIHTPTPWSINEWPQSDASIRIGALGTPRIAAIELSDVSMNEQKANAAFIVKAVNCHDELLEALKQHHDVCMSHDPENYIGCGLHEDTIKAIAKAEGGE